MRPRHAVLLTPLEAAVPLSIFFRKQKPSVNPLKCALPSHSETIENTAALSPVECALTRLSPATSLECALPKNIRGGGISFPIRNPPLVTSRTPLCSSSFFSYCCALFCTHRNHNSFLFKQFRTLWQKHPGVGYPHSAIISFSLVRDRGGTTSTPINLSRIPLRPYLPISFTSWLLQTLLPSAAPNGACISILFIHLQTLAVTTEVASDGTSPKGSI